MINYTLGIEPYRETLQHLGHRAQKLRLSKNWTQQELARRAGIGVATLHRFEKTGQVSLENVLRISVALSAEQPFRHLFESSPQTLSEVLDHDESNLRRRARGRRMKF